MQAFVLVGLGGAIGAMARYGVGVLVGRFWTATFPLATLAVNVIGSVAMGLLIGRRHGRRFACLQVSACWAGSRPFRPFPSTPYP